MNTPHDIGDAGLEQRLPRARGSVRPASMLVVVPALVWPQMTIEIEAGAARSD